MASAKAGELSLVEASEVLGLSYRQTRRGWRRYDTNGDAGLVHLLRGQLGKRRKPPELRHNLRGGDTRSRGFGTLRQRLAKIIRAEQLRHPQFLILVVEETAFVHDVDGVQSAELARFNSRSGCRSVTLGLVV